MRLLACFLVLLASAAHAQPTPPDEALIGEVVEALRAEEQMAASFTGVPGIIGNTSLTPSVVSDSVRARLRADYRPDLLHAALPTLQSPAYQHATERSSDRSDSFTRVAQLMFGPPPKKGTLADSVLSARFLAAAGSERTLRTTMERVIRAVIEVVPEARAELEAEGITADQAIDRALQSASETVAMFALPAMRAELAGVPVGEVETLIAYYGSPAGEYIQAALVDGTLDALVPTLVTLAAAQIPASSEEMETETVVIPSDTVPAPKVKF